MLELRPCTRDAAFGFIKAMHRHHGVPIGYLWCQAVHCDAGELRGVAVSGRPVARGLDDGETAEVTRCCVLDDAPKGSCSFLYARCWAAAKALGWRRLVTYTLQSESGASLRGAGWKAVAQLQARDPAAWQTRPGRDWHPVVGQQKLRWEIA